jgi:predicted DNA-binding transcriptional regulator AlpA
MSYPKSNPSLPLYTPPSKIRQVTGVLCRSSALLREKDDPSFPRRVRISSGLTAWKTSELIDYLEKCERVK